MLTVTPLPPRPPQASPEPVHFKIKSTAQFEKMMNVFCQRTGLDRESTKFFFDGQPVKPTDTAETLSMEDGDLIDALQNMKGGGM